MTKEKTTKKSNGLAVKRATKVFNIVMFTGMVAGVIALTTLVDEPTYGVYALAGFNGVAALSFIWQAIK